MPKRKATRARARRTTLAPRQSVNERITVVTAPPRRRAPVRHYASQAVGYVRRRAHHHGTQTTMGGMITTGVVAYALGYVDKGGINFPTLPILGRAGTIAFVAYMLRGKHPILGKVATAAAAISGYEMGRNGVISGDDHMMGGVASQV